MGPVRRRDGCAGAADDVPPGHGADPRSRPGGVGGAAYPPAYGSVVVTPAVIPQLALACRRPGARLAVPARGMGASGGADDGARAARHGALPPPGFPSREPPVAERAA